MKAKTVVLTFLASLTVWIALNSSIETGVLISGTIVSLLISIFFTKSGLFETVTIKGCFASIGFLFTFIIELIKSNFDVAFRVVTPRVRINPAIIEVKTKLKSKLGRLALANAITLTPGTLTTEIKNDTLYIHWIDATSTDVEGATKAIVSKFEKYLEVIFG